MSVGQTPPAVPGPEPGGTAGGGGRVHRPADAAPRLGGRARPAQRAGQRRGCPLPALPAARRLRQQRVRLPDAGRVAGDGAGGRRPAAGARLRPAAETRRRAPL